MTTDAGRFPKQKQAPRPLPPGWRWVRLGELLTTVETGSRPRGGSIGIASGVPSLSAEHMTRSGTFDFSTLRFVPYDFYEKMPKGRIRVGDILIVKDGATTGKTAFVDESFPFSEAVVNEHVFLCRPDSTIVISRFLFFWLHSPIGQRAIRSIYKGSTIGGINQDFVDSLWVLYPPLSEQRRIAEMLVKQISSVQNMRKAAQRQLLAAQAMQGAILRQVFRYKEGDALPPGWRWVRLGEICSINPPRCRDLKRASDALTTFVPMEAVSDETGLIVHPQVRAYQEVARGYTYFEEGDIIWAKITPCMENGKSAIARDLLDGMGFGSTEFHVIRPGVGILPEFVWHFVRQPRFRLEATRHFVGAVGQQRVPDVFLRDAYLPLPPLDEQRAIVTRLEAQMADMQRLRAAAERQLEAINALPGALLNEVFGGYAQE